MPDIGDIVSAFEIPGYTKRNKFATTVNIWTRLKCGITLGNDHGIRWVIDKIDLVGPKGVNFPKNYKVKTKKIKLQ